MSNVGYAISVPAVALVATTAKTAVFVLAPSQFGTKLTKVRFGFDGVTATDKSVLAELCLLSAATNSTVGTANTSGSSLIFQKYGRVIAAGHTAGYNCTSEPTVLTVVDSWLVSPYGGSVAYDYSLGTEPDQDISKGFALRFTAPTSAVNVKCELDFERI